MRTAVVTIEGVTPYSQSKAIPTEKERDETAKDHEERCWRERCHVNSDGYVYIPPMAFKNALSEAAKYKPRKIPGEGKTTYTKHIEAGVFCLEPVVLPIKIEDVKGEWYFVPSDGRRGGTTRVWKCFPEFPKWGGDVVYEVLDDKIDSEVFEQYVKDCGMFIGLGRSRPRNNGFFGRFEVQKIEWTHDTT